MIPPKYWSPTKKLMVLGAMAGGKLVEDTATGNPLTFITDKAKPLKSLLIPFTPQKEGTGDPSPQNIRSIIPWNGLTVFGGGKNLFDASAVIRRDGYLLNDNGVEQSTTQSGYTLNRTKVKSGGTYTFSGTIVQGAESFRLYFYNGDTFVSRTAMLNDHDHMPYTFTVPENCDGIAFQYNKITVDFSTFQLEAGSTASAYEEYRPITETDIVFPAMGKNLLNPVKYLFSTNTSRGLTFEVQSDGSVKVTGTTESSDFGPGLTKRFQLPAGTYYGYRDDGDVYVTYRKSTAETGGETSGLISPFTLDGSEWVYCNIYVRNPGTFDTIIHPQIARENTQTAYEPFTNAVYGGTPDIISGRMLVEWYGVSAKWGQGINKSFIGEYERRWFDMPSGLIAQSSQYYNNHKSEVGCNIAKYVLDWNKAETHFYCSMENNTNHFYVFLPQGTSDETDIQCICKLKEPFEVQLTPEQIAVLVGNNTIWSDADGSMTAVYLKKK